jgi:small subunit ribosomal protein S23
MKEADKPLWYDIYRAFPPLMEPRVDRAVPDHDKPLRQIFYEEDAIRA